MKIAIFTLLLAGACVAFPQMPSSSSDECGLSSELESLLKQLTKPVQELLSMKGKILAKVSFFFKLFPLNKPQVRVFIKMETTTVAEFKYCKQAQEEFI